MDRLDELFAQIGDDTDEAIDTPPITEETPAQ
jgi:hypothetical protein